MVKIDRYIFADVKAGRMSIEQLADYLLKNYPVYEIALSLAATINYTEPKPIVISEEEFRTHFRIRGVKDNGEAELRGRKPKGDTTP